RKGYRTEYGLMMGDLRVAGVASVYRNAEVERAIRDEGYGLYLLGKTDKGATSVAKHALNRCDAAGSSIAAPVPDARERHGAALPDAAALFADLGAVVSGEPADAVEAKWQRGAAKTAVYGMSYGAGVTKVAAIIGRPEATAEAIRDAWWDRYKGLADLFDEMR